MYRMNRSLASHALRASSTHDCDFVLLFAALKTIFDIKITVRLFFR